MKWTIAGATQRTAAQRFGAALGMLLASFIATSAAHAENVLQDVSYAPLSGGRVQITLKLAAPAAGARAFTTETPPRIALDVPDTRSAVSQRHMEVASGATSAINGADAGGRTRVVVVDSVGNAYVADGGQGRVLVVSAP